MARKLSEMRELAAKIESLETEQKKLLKRVLTPQIELRLAMDQMAETARHVPTRVLDRTID